MEKIINKLSVFHYPQVPCKPFIVGVKDEEEAYKIYNTLADQHLWLFKNRFIPDFSNAIMVLMWDDEMKDWVDYYNEKEDMDWDEFVEEYLETRDGGKMTCEYCQNDFKEIIDDDDYGVGLAQRFTDKKYVLTLIGMGRVILGNVNYCPMCGRNLSNSEE